MSGPDGAASLNVSGLPHVDQPVQLSMSMLTKLLQLCRNDSTDAPPVTTSHRHSGNSPDAFLYIIAVLLFYAFAMVVLMVKYIKREEQEAELSYYFSEFVNRDKFSAPRYQNRQKVKAVKKSLMYKPLLTYSQNMAQAFQRTTLQALQHQRTRAQEASARIMGTGPGATASDTDAAGKSFDAGAGAGDSCANQEGEKGVDITITPVMEDACSDSLGNADSNAMLSALFGADGDEPADAASVRSAETPSAALSDASPEISTLPYIDSSDGRSSEDSCVVAMYKITVV